MPTLVTKTYSIKKNICNSKRVQNIDKEIPETVSSQTFLDMIMFTDLAMLQTELSAKKGTYMQSKCNHFAVALKKDVDQNNFL